MRSDTIVGYTYNADIYCTDCIVDELQTRGDLMDAYPAGFDTEAWLNRCAAIVGIDRFDEGTFDSGDFPKVVFADSAADYEFSEGEAERCGRCHEALV